MQFFFFFFNFQSVVASESVSAFYLQFFYELCQVLVSFACHIAKPSVRALKTKLKQIEAYGQKVQKNIKNKNTQTHKKKTKQKTKKAIDREIVDNFCSLSQLWSLAAYGWPILYQR